MNIISTLKGITWPTNEEAKKFLIISLIGIVVLVSYIAIIDIIIKILLNNFYI